LSKKAEGFSLRFVLINTGNISRKVLSKVLRSFDKNFERLQYGIVQKVKEITDNEVILGPGTMYGSLSKMEKDGLIQFVCEEDKRKIYQITDLGTEVLELEWKRIRRLYRNAQEGME
jgi:DNA-binding PadR family transcriptional regulator